MKIIYRIEIRKQSLRGRFENEHVTGGEQDVEHGWILVMPILVDIDSRFK